MAQLTTPLASTLSAQSTRTRLRASGRSSSAGSSEASTKSVPNICRCTLRNFSSATIIGRTQISSERRLRDARSVSTTSSMGSRSWFSIAVLSGAQYWARELGALGHEVRLMPAQYVKAYVKRNKNDAADAEAICEAVRRPSMRFVPVKSAEQQAVLTMHRARDLLVRQRTATINRLRGLL